MRISTSLKVTVPLILLGFAATLSAVNLVYHVPQAEREAEEESRKRLVQEMSRLQSTVEYLLLKGDFAVAQHEIAVLAHNHDFLFAALMDDRQTVIAATRRAWLERPIADVLPQFDLEQAAGAIRQRRAGVTTDANGDTLLGYAGVLMGTERDELRPSRTGSMLLAYDLHRYKAEARALVMQQSLYWAGWVTALALAMWLVFHFLLTRRTARLVHAAEELASGNLDARSGLKGSDELGRLGSAFDAMAMKIAQNIEDKKRAAEELARQRESLHQREKLAALGSLLAGVAHELNNPLSVVVARAVLLEEQGDSRTQTAAQKIRTAAERCARIVRTFLAMARQQRPERGPVAINGVVSAALDIAAYAIRTSSIDVTLDLAQDAPLVLADADQLHQVLLNLIINAQQSLQEHPLPRRLRIATRFDSIGDVLAVTVEDNGPGIPEHLRARVFEPYFTTKPTGMGIGVGLAVSLGIVEAHGGTLTVACPESGGAGFTITLPVHTTHAPELEAGSSAHEHGDCRSILVVDDEPDIRETLSEILSTARHRVVAVASGREALERLSQESYDVIFTDMRMPDLDGRALYGEIERRWPEQAQRVVFVTGDTLATTLRDFVSASGRPVIEKPFLPGDVRRVVAEVDADSDPEASI
ncbi:MAG TPA: ATP-binding protein [Casimicrobiaceae bacterium]|nr:ATP-binding protein [Casimicrobiaceae bacterium]